LFPITSETPPNDCIESFQPTLNAKPTLLSTKVKKRKVTQVRMSDSTPYLAHCALCGACARKDSKYAKSQRLFQKMGCAVPLRALVEIQLPFWNKFAHKSHECKGHKSTDGSNIKLCNSCYMTIYKDLLQFSPVINLSPPCNTQLIPEDLSLICSSVTSVFASPIQAVLPPRRRTSLTNYTNEFSIIVSVGLLKQALLHPHVCLSPAIVFLGTQVVGEHCILSFKCTNCKAIIQFANSTCKRVLVSPTHPKGFYLVNLIPVLASLLSGLTFTDYTRFYTSRLDGLIQINHQSWHDIEFVLHQAIEQEVEESKKLVDDKPFLILAGDCGFATRRNANAGTYALMEFFSRKIVAEHSCIKDRLMRVKDEIRTVFQGNHKATSQAIESAGFRECVKQLVEAKKHIKWGVFVSDRDCKVDKILRESPHLKHVVHVFDAGHIKKTLTKELVKMFGTGKRFKPLVVRVANWWMRCLKEGIRVVRQDWSRIGKEFS
jgi:hypothetical protein